MSRDCPLTSISLQSEKYKENLVIFKKIELIVPQKIADSFEQKMPIKRAIKKIVDDPQTRINVTTNLIGAEKEI